MPIEFECHACHRRYQVRDELAGRSAKCKSCGATVAVPGPEPAPPEEVEIPISPRDESLAAAIGLDSGGPAPSAGIETAAAHRHTDTPVSSFDRDPWFFVAMEVFGGLVVVVAVIQFLLILMYGVIVSVSGSAGVTSSTAALYTVLMSGLGFLGAMIVTAPIFLAVDIARSLRRIVRNTSR
jgi:hypothetical protein